MYDAGIFCSLAGTLGAVTSASSGKVAVNRMFRFPLLDLAGESVEMSVRRLHFLTLRSCLKASLESYADRR
jgi:hypothetical protein